MSGDFDKVLRKFRREMMGSSVAHMTDEQLDAWMEPFRRTVDTIINASSPGYPAWLINRRNEARSKLLAVLVARSAGSPTR